MTFAAMATWQAWTLIGGAAALAAGLFFLKLRPPRILVPSLSLWQRVLDASPDITRWERIRRVVSLVVTIAIAVILGLAVTRPAFTAGSGAAGRGRALIVIDSSWSMLAATRAGETRWDRALAEARRIVASSDQVAIATTADGLIEGPTDDRVLIESALGKLTASGLEASVWPAVAGMSSVHFITDGASTRPLDRAVVVHSVFEPAANVAITAFDVRSSVGTDRRGSPQIAEAYLEVANFAPSSQQIHIVVSRGNATIGDSRADVASGAAYRQVIPLARQGEAALRARIEAPQNALAVDDESVAWIERAQRLSVVVVGEHPEWLRRLLAADADIRATFVPPASYRDGGREDVTIFDRWAPTALPARPALFVSPPPDVPWLSAGSGVAAAEERRPRWEVAATHPVLRGVDPLTIRIERARGYSSSSLVPLALSKQGTPLVSVSESPDRRFVVLAFGPSESNLALAPGFPVFVANTLEWLAHPERRTRALAPGLASFGAGTTRVTGPGGISVPLARVDDTTVAVLRTPGLYVAEGGGARSTFAVNLADPSRSNIARTNAQPGTNRAPARRLLDRQWWVACVIAAFLLALAEWWTWQRRVTV
jgi:hypothetical protein